jgi:hypothetical protein
LEKGMDANKILARVQKVWEVQKVQEVIFLENKWLF